MTKKITPAIIFILAIIFSGCANVTRVGSIQKKSQLQEQQYGKKLLVRRALGDKRSSRFYWLQLNEDLLIQPSIKDIEVVTIKKYPYSFTRKLDDFMMGIIAAPFTPIAIIGGIIDGDSDFIFFPLSAFNPFKNFRPQKGGLFTGPVAAQYDKFSEKTNLRSLHPRREVRPLKNINFTVSANNRQIQLTTDHNGYAKLDLAKISDLCSAVHIHVRIDNDMACTHVIQQARILAISNKKQLPPQTLKKPYHKNLERLYTIAQKMPTPPSITKTTKLNIGLSPVPLYKLSKYGYHINHNGLAVIAIPVLSQTQVYADEYLRYKSLSQVYIGRSYYIFDFAFDPINEIVLAVKIGSAPAEEDALGWVSATDIFLGNTSHRLKISKPVALYSTYDSCRRASKLQQKIYFASKEQPIYLPVLEKKGQFWGVAYPQPQGKKLHLSFAWLRWVEEPGVDLEVRVMKHKLDMAIKYLEKNVIWGENNTVLRNDFITKLEGPFYLLKKTGENYLTSFNRGGQYQDRFIQGHLIDLPLERIGYRQFQRYVVLLGDLLVKKDLWTGQDIIYLPLNWLR